MISEQGQRDVTLLLSIACVFWVLRQILEQVLLRASRHYRELEEDKRHRFDLYVLSLINAVAVSAVSVYTIITNTYTAWNGGFVAGAFVGGYVLHDFWATRNVWMAYPSDCLHHIISLVIAFGITATQPDCAPIVPHFGLLEVSTIFLDILWLLRELKVDTPFFVRLNELLFALAFFVFRILYLPYLMYRCETEFVHMFGDSYAMQCVRVVLYGLVLLQIYWFRLIWLKFVSKTKPSKKGAKKAN